MPSVGGVDAANAAMLQAIAQLNQVVAEAIVDQAEFARKVVALNIGQSVEDNRIALVEAELDKLV